MCIRDSGSSDESDYDAEEGNISDKNQEKTKNCSKSGNDIESKVATDQMCVGNCETYNKPKLIPDVTAIVSDIIANDILTCAVLKKEKSQDLSSFQMHQDSENRTRCSSISSSSSDSSLSSLSSDESSTSDESSSSEEVEETQRIKPDPKGLKKGKEGSRKQKNSLKVKGELTTADLPPIEDLHITVPEVECVPLGQNSSTDDDLVVDKARRLAAHVLECSAADLNYSDARFAVTGTDRAVDFTEIADIAYHGARIPQDGSEQPGLEATVFHLSLIHI